ncbi:MAG: tetratricopeptide repeat protein [Myxococcales bacterium]|nr:tetratricopeptide repeat protein [Myxococcales bacterium]
MTTKALAILPLLAALVLGAGEARADRASAHYHAAMAAKRAGRIGDAIAELKKALAERDDYAAAHYSIGILYRRKQQHFRAIIHLERAAKLSPHARVYYSLGLSYYKAGQKKKGIAALRKAAELDPKNTQYVSQWAILQIRRDPAKAIAMLEKARRAQPKNADITHQLGLAYRRATMRMPGKGNKARRESYLRKAEGLIKSSLAMGESANRHFDLAVVYRRLGEARRAIRHYEAAVRLDPKFASAYWDLGHMYTQEKRADEAIAAFNKYLALRPSAKDAKVARQRLKDLRKKK